MNSDRLSDPVRLERIDAQWFLFGGIAGVVGVASYVVGIAVDFNAAASSMTAIASFCIFGIVSMFALRDSLSIDGRSRLADLALLFAVTGFATLLSMIAVQLAVRTHAKAILESTPAGSDREMFRLAVQLTRRVDWGMDVSWDLLGGTALLLFGVAMCGNRHFRWRWGLPLAALAAALLVVNLATFPVPPASAGLVDLGPFMGLYMAAVNVRLMTIGAQILRRRKRESAGLSMSTAPDSRSQQSTEGPGRHSSKLDADALAP